MNKRQCWCYWQEPMRTLPRPAWRASGTAFLAIHSGDVLRRLESARRAADRAARAAERDEHAGEIRQTLLYEMREMQSQNHKSYG
eukprot:scaffold57717_cov33-Tisochrysis_lutea.AAC.2